MIDGAGEDAVEWELAPPDMTLGRLQRGRGAGWLETARHPNGPDILRTCLDVDRRWDRQVDSRGRYYAELAQELGLTAVDLWPDRSDEPDGLAFDVVEELARLGDASAAEILLTWLRPGDHDYATVSVIRSLPNAGDHDDALVRRLVERFTADELAALIPFLSGIAPLERWASTWLPVRVAMRVAEDRRRSRARDGAAPPAEDAPIDVVLAYPWSLPFPKQLVARLAMTAGAAESDALRRASIGPWGTGRRLALEVLARRGDTFALDHAVGILTSDEVGAHVGAARCYVDQLPAAVTLPLARGWFDALPELEHVAVGVLAKHGTDVDVDRLVTALAHALDTDDRYLLCDAADGLARFPERGPHPELRDAFETTDYAYARRWVALAMAATDPQFADRFAGECLWDCDTGTQDVGAAHVPLGDDGIRARLRQLAAGDENDRVQVTATNRLR